MTTVLRLVRRDGVTVFHIPETPCRGQLRPRQGRGARRRLDGPNRRLSARSSRRPCRIGARPPHQRDIEPDAFKPPQSDTGPTTRRKPPAPGPARSMQHLADEHYRDGRRRDPATANRSATRNTDASVERKRGVRISIGAITARSATMKDVETVTRCAFLNDLDRAAKVLRRRFR